MFCFCFCFGHFNYVSRFHAAGLGATTQAPSQQHALHLDWLMVLRRQRKPRAISAVFTADIFCLPASCCHFIEPNAYPLLRRQRAHFSFGAVVYGTCCLSPPLEARQLHSSPLLFFPPLRGSGCCCGRITLGPAGLFSSSPLSFAWQRLLGPDQA